MPGKLKMAKTEIEIKEVHQVKGLGIDVSLVYPPARLWLPVNYVNFITREYQNPDHRLALIPAWLYKRTMDRLKKDGYFENSKGPVNDEVPF